LVTEAGEVQIIGDTGVGHCRRILEILGKTKRGKFIRVGGEVIASQLRKELNCAEIDIGTITSCVKHIRGNIRTRTRKQLKLIVGLMDVLVRDEQGYHLNDERITVRIYDSEEIVWGDDDESSATLAAGQSAPEVATESVLAEPKTSTDGTSSDIEEFDGLNQRQSWIVGKAKQGWKLTREQIEKKFSISERTAKRDLGDLRKRGLLKYIRRPHPGHYQLKASD
jgi:hypothetical protein